MVRAVFPMRCYVMWRWTLPCRLAVHSTLGDDVIVMVCDITSVWVCEGGGLRW